MKCWWVGLTMFICSAAYSQSQTCPANINFATGDLTHWFAYTGNNSGGNGQNAIIDRYDSTKPSPNGTQGRKTIPEYGLPSVQGIQVITSQSTDPYGGFSTIPTINGYSYDYSILIGSTAVSRTLNANGTARGGYVRGISYVINVPSGPTSKPYTMTYAYAMVLENGTHNSDEQPMCSATLMSNDSVITCASPAYYLPTFNNAAEGQRGALLDTAAALRNGFKLSSSPSPNADPGPNGGSIYLQDVWTKGWTEVTFDLSPYRGQKVTLTLEADNCVPGGHFAYFYVAIRNSCSGLQISGDSLVCVNSDVTYSIPALAGATYEWLVPTDWQVLSNNNTGNIIEVVTANHDGFVVAREQNSCADLRDTFPVKVVTPAIGGTVSSDATVCSGKNSNTLQLAGNTGHVVKWVYSHDGINWTDISDTAHSYTYVNLTSTTQFKALAQKETVCPPDSSSAALVIVDPRSAGGNLNPANTDVCKGQNKDAVLSLLGSVGDIVDWQSSADNVNWTSFNPVYTDSVYSVTGINASIEYRAIVKSGVCAPDTSSVAYVRYYDVPFPQAAMEPADTTLCYGGTATLNASITTGTSYVWLNTDSLVGDPSGIVVETPFPISDQASPLVTTDYVLSVQNAGCPNPLLDTFHVAVLPQIIVNAGRDTNVVVNQPLQLQAVSSDPGDAFTWTPSTGLDDPDIPNPIAIYSAAIDKVRYTVRATSTTTGCFGETSITVRVFKTAPDIFVPNAFTPGKNINNIFRPIPVGIATLQYFRVFNRLGRLVYSTSQMGQGWDGTVNGQPQDSDSYVWMAQGTDYTGKTIFKKGVMVLIR